MAIQNFHLNKIGCLLKKIFVKANANKIIKQSNI